MNFKKMIVLDIETYFDKQYSLKKLSTEEYIRDPRFLLHGVGIKIDSHWPIWLTRDQFERNLDKLKPLFARHLCYGHNFMFDAAALAWHYGCKFGLMGCTLSMARPIIGVDAPASLDALAQRFGFGTKGRELQSFEGKRDLSPQEQIILGDYCTNDVTLTHKLFQKLKQGFPREEMIVIDRTLRMFVEPAAMLDVDRLRAYHETEVKQKQEFIDQLQQYDAVKDALSEETNAKVKKGVAGVLQSNDKFAKLLFDLGVEPPQKWSEKKKTMTWAFAKNDPEFKALKDHPDDRVKLAIEARLGAKSTLGETRSARFIEIAKRNNGFLPVPKKYWGAHTGRDSGTDNINLANLPRGGELRASIVAPKGYLVCAADSAAIEARGIFWMAGQQDFLDMFEKQDQGLDKDVYSKMASRIYGRDIDRKKRPVEDFIPGFIGKAVTLGCNYQLYWPKFQEMIRVGMLGGPGVLFDEKFVDTLEVDVVEFAKDRFNMKEVKRTFRSWDDRKTHVIHCAVSKKIIDDYRKSIGKVTKFWKFLGDTIIPAMAAGKTICFGPGKIFRTGKDCIHTPSGFALLYPGLHQEMDEDGKLNWIYFGRNKKKTKIYSGKLAENLTQHLMRLPITYQLTLIAKRYKIITSTYDEIVCLVPERNADQHAAWIVEQMKRKKPWMEGLPLNAEAHWGKNYKDCK